VEGGNLCGEVLTEYRGHLICSFCFRQWQAMEKEKGVEVKFLDVKWRGEKITKSKVGKGGNQNLRKRLSGASD